jgi:arylsulfatase A-like enzyme
MQLYHMGWDQHFSLPKQLSGQCYDADQPTAALIKDLKMRGLLDDTLVVWGGEFGRTSYCQGKLTRENYGRDHHPRCFSLWAAGGGIKPGTTFGQTDDFCYNLVDKNGAPIEAHPTKHHKEAVHVHDLHATLLHQLGIDHTKLTYKFQGRQYRLTDVHGHVVKDILS